LFLNHSLFAPPKFPLRTSVSLYLLYCFFAPGGAKKRHPRN
jgi:hypothetical protein